MSPISFWVPLVLPEEPSPYLRAAPSSVALREPSHLVIPVPVIIALLLFVIIIVIIVTTVIASLLSVASFVQTRPAVLSTPTSRGCLCVLRKLPSNTHVLG